MILTEAAFALLVANPACNPMGMPQKTLWGIAMTESGMETEAVHMNRNGTSDYGLFQLNATNLSHLGLSPETAKDPCRSMAGGEAVLLSRYNTGSPIAGITNGYAMKVMARVGAVTVPVSQPPLITLADQIVVPRTRSREAAYAKGD